MNYNKIQSLTLTLVGLVSFTTVFGRTTVPNGLKNFPYQFALIGDQPYTPTTTPGAIEAYTPYINLINDINSYNKVLFTVHVGDIKRGNTRCDDNVYTDNLTMFNRFLNSMIYLPGDNEWTDCHRANNGGFNPVERLALIRNTFYNTNHTLGQKTFTVMRQSDEPNPLTAYCPTTPDPLATITPAELPAGCQFRENVMWTYGVVLFVGLNQPGSNNNRGRTKSTWQDPGNLEYNARNAANLAWLDKAIGLATSDSTIRGIMIISQANPFDRFIEPPSASNDNQVFAQSGYALFIKKVRDLMAALAALNLKKPVIVVNGDTHYFRLDKPMTTAYPACTAGVGIDANPCLAVPTPPFGNAGRLMSLSRVEVFGDADADWIRVTIDPDDPNLFSFSPQRVPGN